MSFLSDSEFDKHVHKKKDAISNTKKRRSRIAPRQGKSNFKALIAVLKNFNLGNYSLPVSVGFHEPLTSLQKGAEMFQFSYLLDKAAECEDSLEQMVYVSAFEVAMQSILYHRISTPFSPLINETYECDRTKDLGWRLFSEYYAHYPSSVAVVIIYFLICERLIKKFSIYPLNPTQNMLDFYYFLNFEGRLVIGLNTK